MTGTLRLRLDLDAEGHVVSATPRLEAGTLTAAVITCVVKRAEIVEFEAPQICDSARIELTLTFSSVPDPCSEFWCR
jgi:hypothetical protein